MALDRINGLNTYCHLLHKIILDFANILNYFGLEYKYINPERGNKNVKKALRVDHRGDILTVDSGWLICPHCGGAKVLQLMPGTKAKNLVVFCKRCGVESIVNIDECPCLVPVP